jgi:hypothetical protein
MALLTACEQLVVTDAPTRHRFLRTLATLRATHQSLAAATGLSGGGFSSGFSGGGSGNGLGGGLGSCLGGGSGGPLSSGSGGGYGWEGVSAGASHGPQSRRGHRLPGSGFATLAALCDAALRSCLLRDDMATPLHLLKLAAQYFMEHGGGETESLSSRVAEHRVFVEPALWDHVLKTQLAAATTTATTAAAAATTATVNQNSPPVVAPSLAASECHGLGITALARTTSEPKARSSAHAASSSASSASSSSASSSSSSSSSAAVPKGAVGSEEGLRSDLRLVEQLVTSLLHSMRAVGSMTPHRALVFVLRVVASYGLSENQVSRLFSTASPPLLKFEIVTHV